MKNLYALALAAAVTFSASAAKHSVLNHRENATLKTEAPAKKAAPAKVITSMTKVAELDGSKVHKVKEGDVYTIEGEYIMYIGDYYFEDSVGSTETTVMIEADEDEAGLYWMYEPGFNMFVTEIAFEFDETTNVATFFPLNAGSISGFDCVFTPFEYIYTDPTTGAGYISPLESYEVSYDPTHGALGFELDHGFAWIAYLEGEPYTYFNVFDVEGCTQEIPVFDEEEEGQWKDVGQATFIDGWITPSYQWNDGTAVDPEEYAYQVTLQQDVNHATRFRLWEPYQTIEWVLYDANTSKLHGQIVFDVKDPEHAYVEAGRAAGFKNSNGQFYVFDLLGWQIYHMLDGSGFTYTDYDVYAEYLQEIYDFMEEKGQPFSTYNPETGVFQVNKVVFDINAACTSAYSWNGVEFTTATITLPEEVVNGVVGITFDNSEAPVEFFNLQGIRVNETSAGNVYIRRQGSDVQKVVVK